MASSKDWHVKVEEILASESGTGWLTIPQGAGEALRVHARLKKRFPDATLITNNHRIFVSAYEWDYEIVQANP